ncbi:MAG: hypothetical protein ACFCUR_00050 [Rhodomicrobiaceae bacterium]
MRTASHLPRRSASVVLICLCFAQIVYAARTDATLADRVAIELRGRIEPKCSLSDMDGELRFAIGADRGRDQSAAPGFTIDCNTPFISRLSADHGAMRRQSAGGASEDGRLQLPYRVSLTIPVQGGGTLSAKCDSATLGAAGAGWCEADSGQQIAINKRGRILVKFPVSVEQPMEGQYTDNMRIEVTMKQ